VNRKTQISTQKLSHRNFTGSYWHKMMTSQEVARKALKYKWLSITMCFEELLLAYTYGNRFLRNNKNNV